jgi:hypothetical protein
MGIVSEFGQVAECCHLVAKLTLLTGTTAVRRRFVGERLFHLVSPFMFSIKRLSSSKQALHHITWSYLFLASLGLFTICSRSNTHIAPMPGLQVEEIAFFCIVCLKTCNAVAGSISGQHRLLSSSKFKAYDNKAPHGRRQKLLASSSYPQS